MSKLNVAVVFGGKSGEHEVSIVSARSIMDAMDRERFAPVPVYVDRAGTWERGLEGVDVVFPIVHGPNGEDGRLQGHLETLGLPYVGSDAAASAVCMDKDLTKRVLASAGIPVAPWITLRRGEPVPETAFPAFVKPARLGSSVGVSKAKDRAGLEAAVLEAFRYDDKILIEQAVPNARELECAALGNGPHEITRFGEIVPSAEFYTFHDKYVDGAAKAILPAELPPETEQAMRAAAMEACRVLGIEGLARIDFLLDRATGEWVLNEPNTLPGFTSISMYPKLWLNEGLTYPALITRLIELALERHEAKKRLVTDYASGSDWYRETKA